MMTDSFLAEIPMGHRTSSHRLTVCMTTNLEIIQ